MIKFQWIDAFNIGDHVRLNPADRVLYLREYTSRKNFNFSETNNLISNLKKKRGEGGYAYYKPRAIQQCSCEIAAGLDRDWLKGACLVPVPPSRMKGDPDHDDRMLQVCTGISQHVGFQVTVREIVRQAASIRSAHESADRPSVEELLEIYEVDENQCGQNTDVIAIVDDVLTVGNHFRAMQIKLASRFPNAEIYGIFVARRIFANDTEIDFGPVD